MDYLQVTFRLDALPSEAPDLIEAVLLEQTVETPADVARRDTFVREQMMGLVQEIKALGGSSVRATLAIPILTAGIDPAQFLTVLFGNVSLHTHVALESFEIPPTLESFFPGPRFGIGGLRDRLGVRDRPLTCSALKPVGLSTARLSELCRSFARGGIDVIKDDHYLANQPFSPFDERVRACQDIVEDVSADTGRRVIYCPNLSGTPDDVLRQLEFAQAQGVGAVMLAPAIMGLPFVYQLVHAHLDVPLLAHPSFSGSNRIPTEVLLGRIFRLFGADAVIFANYGGRFGYTPEECGRIATELRAPWSEIAASWPVPAGGMTVERAGELIDFFGIDTMLLVGGNLLLAGDDLLDRTREFTAAVAEAAAHRPLGTP